MKLEPAVQIFADVMKAIGVNGKAITYSITSTLTV